MLEGTTLDEALQRVKQLAFERDQARKVGQRLTKALTGEEPLYADWLQTMLQENPWLMEGER
jgi:hypothetical protein